MKLGKLNILSSSKSVYVVIFSVSDIHEYSNWKHGYEDILANFTSK